jgi:GrpB-like predicted nucleotidyltransferase (UPF0157 family)
MSRIPSDPNALLTRIQLADALTETGYPTKATTLSTKATRGVALHTGSTVREFCTAGVTRLIGRRLAFRRWLAAPLNCAKSGGSVR